MAESPAATADDHVARNREAWDRMAVDYVESGHRDWASNEVTWGIFRVPEARIGMLPDDLTGMDTIELGCGTGYVSAWLARRGAHPVGIDNSPAQLETARRFQQEFGIDFPLHHRRSGRSPNPRRRHHQLPLRHGGVGTPMAVRRGVEGPEAIGQIH